VKEAAERYSRTVKGSRVEYFLGCEGMSLMRWRRDGNGEKNHFCAGGEGAMVGAWKEATSGRRKPGASRVGWTMTGSIRQLESNGV
jgi:hypothetical protein